jgi:DNA helicase-2/ATP-dependent DNA helicase PcrA
VPDDSIFRGLNEEQIRAVNATRGPVCILAGAGSGKTTTVTRRIANQVASGAFEPGEILAVTFTDKAAGEMRSRLETLGAQGVRARTFHSAALQQLHHLAADMSQEILPSKAVGLRQLANSLPKPYKFRPAGDLATEIEWAKNRRIGIEEYLDSLGPHEPPIPADLMAGIYKRYEHGKRERNLIDFEDVLELAIQMFQSDDGARERMWARYRAFTVDEYQDVNLLQETLLKEWLGERDELCVVGDDYQSIYGFTGATPRYLLEMPSRYPRTQVVRLESNYRSTPQVLSLANRLVPKLGGAEKVLRATREDGAEPRVRGFSRAEAEIAFLIDRIQSLHEEGVAYEQMAILYRVNYRSEDYEEALAAASVPYRVQDGAFLNRRSAREVLRSLQRSNASEVAAQVLKVAERSGYLEELPDGLGDQELTRQNDLARLIRLGEEFDDGTRTGAEFVADVQARFGAGEGRGVNLLTYHRSKGLEFDAVFLSRVEVGELPFKRSRSEEALAEERRLFYVGITRARTHLTITWVNDGKRKGSPFVGELGAGGAADKRGKLPKPQEEREVLAASIGLEVQLSGGFEGSIVGVGAESVTVQVVGGAELEMHFGEIVTANGKTLPLGPASERVERKSALYDELKAWRLKRCRDDGVPAYVIFHDATLEEIAQREPVSTDQLAEIGGVGPAKLERYGSEIVEIIQGST